ncbi:hypothetical protein [Geothermobacter hydrogeniphilus]|uniref:Lipoprotein n=1 Tax=Geothermobacter hydrogeniphilus TaxID=1969733 RepID=A0A1X0XQ72_9BACT|nr:hypothetical protein [Geothermobacter hydrogeniphilus]ORJ55051.1 hypothetical protein B5V00_15375 [Geothermobacter hydrogeniphilus]
MVRVFALLLILLLTGCSGGSYLLPKKEYQSKVKTLGVVPLLVDPGSLPNHPQGDKILALLRRQNVDKEQRLVDMLRKEKSYFDVRDVKGSPDSLFRQLIAGQSIEGEGSRIYRKYRFNRAAVASLCADHVVDGLLVVIFNGLDRVESRRDRTLLSYLEASYQTIQVQAMVVLPDGEVVWEYPGEGSETFLDLQYPDFDEAFYNKTDQVKIRDITLPGLERTLSEEKSNLFSNDSYPKPYADLFEHLSSSLGSGLLGLW